MTEYVLPHTRLRRQITSQSGDTEEHTIYKNLQTTPSSFLDTPAVHLCDLDLLTPGQYVLSNCHALYIYQLLVLIVQAIFHLECGYTQMLLRPL